MNRAVSGFRYFDWELGRFITRDPSGYPDGANNYLYCHNNPINHIDPLGLKVHYNVDDKYLQDTANKSQNIDNKDQAWQKVKKDVRNTNANTRMDARKHAKTEVDKTKEGKNLAKAQKLFNKLKDKSSKGYRKKRTDALNNAQKAYDNKVQGKVDKVMDEFEIVANRFSSSEDLANNFDNIDNSTKNYVVIQKHGEYNMDTTPFQKLQGKNVSAIGLYICGVEKQDVSGIGTSSGVKDIYYSKGDNQKSVGDFGISRAASSKAKNALPSAIIFNPSTSTFVGHEKFNTKIQNDPAYRKSEYQARHGESYTNLEKDKK